MKNIKFMFNCNLCGSPYLIGQDLYEGKQIPLYKIAVCKCCYELNADGWAPHHEETISIHLKAKGLTVPARNEKGYLPLG